MSPDTAHLAPFLHPRRDPLLRRVRWSAAAFVALAMGLWIGAFLIAVTRGMPVTTTAALLIIGGIVYIQTRAVIIADVALALADRRHGLEFAPPATEILQRFGLAVAVPLLALTLAFLRLNDPVVVAGVFILILLVEAVYRLGGFSRWKHPQIYFPALKAILTGDPEKAIAHLHNDPGIPPLDLESSGLAISGLAIRTRKPLLLEQLEQMAERRLQQSAVSSLERLLAVVRADYARLRDPATSSIEEAQALRLLPPSHPRRLALGLFVATAALEQDDPHAALKALGMLHSRDVMGSSARVVVDWLMLQGARRTGDEALAARCERALATFNVKREVGMLTTSELQHPGDPFAVWLRKVISELGGAGK